MNPLFPVLVAACAVAAIAKSKNRAHTVIIGTASAVAVAILVFAAAEVFPSLNTSAVGSAAFDVSLLVGVLAAMIHSRLSVAREKARP